MKLHLFQKIPYLSITSESSGLAPIYQECLTALDSEETGSERCIVLDPSLSVTACGKKDPPEDVDRLIVEKGEADRPVPCDWAIEPGLYEFAQLRTIPDEIEPELSPYVAAATESPLYIRIFKENALVITIQLLYPLK